MSEKVLGIIEVNRSGFMKVIRESLFVMPDRVIVARRTGSILTTFVLGPGIDYYRAQKKGKEIAELPLEDVLKADNNNFAVSNSDITKVELKKGLGKAVNLHITTSKKKHKWRVEGIPGRKLSASASDFMEDYENILRQAFPDNLSVKK